MDISSPDTKEKSESVEKKKPSRRTTKKISTVSTDTSTSVTSPVNGEEKKKRVRKKSCQIDSIEKLRTTDTTSSDQQQCADDSANVNQIHISVGRFNMNVKKTPQMSPEELKEYYDKKFGTGEKISRLVAQEVSDTPIPEPLSVHDVEPVKTKKSEREIHTVLEQFVNGAKQQWPEQTDICCWHCTYPFSSVPIPCPIEHDVIRNRYRVVGIFCSWACVARYSIDNYESLLIVNKFRNDLLQLVENDDLPVALPRHCLDKFGGPFKIDKFRILDHKKFVLSTEHLSYANQEIIEFKY